MYKKSWPLYIVGYQDSYIYCIEPFLNQWYFCATFAWIETILTTGISTSLSRKFFCQYYYINKWLFNYKFDIIPHYIHIFLTVCQRSLVHFLLWKLDKTSWTQCTLSVILFQLLRCYVQFSLVSLGKVNFWRLTVWIKIYNSSRHWTKTFR